LATYESELFLTTLIVRLSTRPSSLTRQYFAAVPISNIAELVPSGFFCPQPCGEHIFPRKTPVFIVINTVTCVTRVTSNRVEVHRFNSQHLAMVRTSNMAELVPSGIFCLQPWFLHRTEHISLRKTPVFMSIQLRSINNRLSIKIIPTDNLAHSGGFGGSSVRPSGGADFFLLFFSFSFFFFGYYLKSE